MTQVGLWTVLPSAGTQPPAEAGARASACGSYRYLLWRRWADEAPLGWVMLNPSTADHHHDDPTIRRCIAFARREGAGGIVVANLFAFRSTSPARLRSAQAAGVDIVGPDNSQALVDLRRGCRTVVVGWGAQPLADQARIAEVRLILIGHSELVCLGRTAAGAPRHPLFVRADQPLEPWSPS